MKGYIGVTSREWFTYLSNKDSVNEINFWRKKTDKFRVLSEGEPFLFIVKNIKGNKGERAVLGKATFKRFEVLKVEEAWNKYGEGNGDGIKESFVTRMKIMFGTDTHNGEIGCIILSDFKRFDNPVYLSGIGIDFKNGIVSGKGIKEREVTNIFDHGFNSVEPIMSKFNELNRIRFTEDEKEFPEGKYMLIQHLVRERNPEVIRLAKARTLQQNGKLICVVCEFDFKEQYGDIGEGYIEGHHTKPISEMDENEHTKVEDIALVCANCHRMLHRKRPWLSIDELKELIL